MKSSFYKIFSIILIGALIILVSLQFISRTPTPNQEEMDVKKASSLIKEGKSSEEIMKGVQILKGILKKDPNQLDAIWELGKLSIQSGQYSIAVGRFEKFVSLTEGAEKVSGLILLSDAYFLDKKRQESLDNLNKALKLNKDSKIETEILERINIINKN